MDLSQSVGPCPICHTCIYESTDTGFLVCEYGHQSQSVWQQEQEEYDANLMAFTRRIKRPAANASQTQIPPPSLATALENRPDGTVNSQHVIQYGEVDRYNVALALQYVLNEQVKIIMRHFGLPAAFAERSRDIWLHFVATLRIEYGEEEITKPDEITEIESKGQPIVIGNNCSNINDPKDGLLSSCSSSDDELSDSSQFDLLPSMPSGERRNRGRKPRKTPSLGLTSILIVIYLAMIDCGFPILAADLRRLVLEGTLPLTETAHLIPPTLLQALTLRGLNIIFRARAWTCPSTEMIMAKTRNIALRLARHRRYWIQPIDVNRLLYRYACELLLPPRRIIQLTIPLINHFLPSSSLAYATTSFESNYSPELTVALCLILFLKLYYRLDSTLAITASHLGLPPIQHLLERWERRWLEMNEFESFPRIGAELEQFQWNDLDIYLQYCRKIGIFLKKDTQPKEEITKMESSEAEGNQEQFAQEKELSTSDGAFERLLVFGEGESIQLEGHEEPVDDGNLNAFKKTLLRNNPTKFIVIPDGFSEQFGQHYDSLDDYEEGEPENDALLKTLLPKPYYFCLLVMNLVIDISPLEIHRRLLMLIKQRDRSHTS